MIDPWEKATAINKWVAQNLRDKNFKAAFAAAGEVARNLTGDCTEHAVLTAAMCRAVGVPSRVVIGLVYVERPRRFRLSTCGTRSSSITAGSPSTRPSTRRPSTRSTSSCSDTSLDGVAPFEAFLPVVPVAGKLTIEPIEIR